MSLYTKMKGNVTYTVVGNPTITDGVVSGFSINNYLDLNTAFNPGIKPWEIQFKLKTGSNITTESYYFRSSKSKPDTNGRFGITLGLYNKHFTMGLCFDGTTWSSDIPASTYTVIANTYYWIKVVYTGAMYYLAYSLDGINFIKTIEYNNSNCLYGGLLVSQIGVYSYSNAYKSPWLGSIDLNETYININRLAWFGDSFSRVKVRTGLTKYTVVGSPTIENGIASNFSNSNYLELHNFDPSKPFELRAKINTTQIGQRQVIYGVGTAGVLRFLIFTDGKLEMDLGTSTSSFNICSLQSSITLSTNTDYWVSLIFTGNKYIMSYSTDGDTFTELGSVNSTLLINNGNAFTVRIGIGVISSTTTFFKGYIDLNASYIKTNNGYFFRGSYQNINFWKIRDSHIDSWYKIIDGELISANENIYLEGTGTQYIDTGFKANQNTRVICKFSCNNISSTQFIFGSRTSYNSNEFGLGIVDQVFRDTWRASFTATSFHPSINEVYTIDKNKNITYLNGEVLVNNTMNSFNSANNLLIFAVSNNSGPTFYYNGKIYYSKVYDNDNLIRHFVPVPTGLKIGNFIVPSNGMFDIVNQQFYSNQRTGNFNINKV